MTVNRFMRMGAAVMVVTLVAGSAQAAAVAVKNSEFDTAALGLGVEDRTAVDLGGGWMTTGTSASYPVWYGIDAINTGVYTDLGNASGNRASMRFAISATNANRQGYITSPMLGDADATVELLVQANSTYTLTVAVGNRNDNVFPGSSSNQRRNCIEFLTDGALRATKPINPWPTDGIWEDWSLSFTTDASGVITSTTGSEGLSWNPVTTVGINVLDKALRIRLRGDTYEKQGPQMIEWDNIRLDVQGPSTSNDLTIKKFFDCDLDNTKDGEDIDLSGWQFNVSNTGHGGSYDQNFTTDANGEINITALDAGDYDVTETVKGTGWVLAAANPRTVTVSGATEVLFGNQLPGDANQDEKVNLSDFTILKAHFGEDPAGWTYGNFNTDTTVNLSDFTILKANFGLGAPSAGGVPEPATVAMLALGAAALLRRRRA